MWSYSDQEICYLGNEYKREVKKERQDGIEKWNGSMCIIIRYLYDKCKVILDGIDQKVVMVVYM